MTLMSSPRSGTRVRLVVLHTAEGARTTDSLYSYFASTKTASCHAGIDDNGVADGWVPYDRAAWTLRNGNPYSDNAEICGFASWTRAEWLAHPGMLAGAAAWVRARCVARGVPIVKLTAADVRAGRAGVCGHVDYTNATGDGTHWDPGPGFPWDIVISMARGDQASDGEDDDMPVVTGPATTGDEWGTLHVPVDGRQFLRIATSYGHAATLGGVTLVDDTPTDAKVRANTKTVLATGTADADRPGPWNLANTDTRYANYSHVVVRYQCDGPVTAWINDRS